MAGDVVESHSVLVEVVQHCQAELVALSVVWLAAAGAASVGPPSDLRLKSEKDLFRERVSIFFEHQDAILMWGSHQILSFQEIGQ